MGAPVSLAFCHLDRALLASLRACDGGERQVKTLLRKRLVREDTEELPVEETVRELVLLDFYYYNLCFGLSHLGGDDEKVSAFFSLMKLLLEDTQERQYSLEECFACFKRLLLQHSVHRPPFSVEVFSQEDVENITSYVLHSFFKHYKLYSYVFLRKKEVDFFRDELDLVEKPVAFPPLAEALTEEEYEKQQEERRQQEEEERQQREAEEKAAEEKAEQERLEEEERQRQQRRPTGDELRDEFRRLATDQVEALRKRVAELEAQLERQDSSSSAARPQSPSPSRGRSPSPSGKRGGAARRR